MNLFNNLYQFRYPKEFRIAAPFGALTIEEILHKVSKRMEPENDMFPSLLADIGTGLWRLKQKMLQPGTNQPLEETRRAYRHLESVWDALTQAEVIIQDHTNQPFDPGLSLKALAYQPTPNLQRPKVIETIKPSVYFKGKAILMGEVIVGTPVEKE